MRRVGLLAALAAAWMALVPGLVSAVVAQDEAAPAPAEAAPEAPKRKVRPKPRPKPQAKPAPQDKPAEAAPAKSADTPPAEPAANPIPSAVPSPAGMNFAAPPVACDPGQAVRYQGDKNRELWVTRSGRITIDNPLRPLTPDVTRVLQVVVAGKVATAYGPDLLSLRRGASPATLEGTIGGRIQWDASLVALPDSLPINAETGEPLAELRFRECGTAPSGKLLPPPKARRTAPTPEAVAAEAEKAEKAAKAVARAAAKAAGLGRPVQPGTGGTPQNLTPPRAPGSALPQGAIP
ncbi:hypothetical protein ASF53_04210 [Methylobacterium sp. Leaf123]|uniref:hypothetical protein n=1 Tax=Methylobacterium sp. Leaf123 TaxID=1736264 RepID=UPI0006F5A312|nr:hypothetical protein [Methylobacterium sp. Leaf123]KQQ23549.1 hypothetical protein ASF53_04210 [Methylobacterium sp. Leaf123]